MAGGGDEILGWAEKHPYATGGVVLGAGLLALWYLGYFSGSGSSDSGQNLAAAYYGAESAQALAGNQVQLATVQADAATNIAKTQADAATAIARSGNFSALGIAQTTTNSAERIAQSANNASVRIAKANAATTLGVATVANASAVDIANTGAMYNYKTIVATDAGATQRDLQDQTAATTRNMQTVTGQIDQTYYTTQAQANEVYATQHTAELVNNNSLVQHLADLLIPAEFANGTNPAQIQAPIGGVTNKVIGAGLISPPYGDLAAAGYSPTQLANITGHY